MNEVGRYRKLFVRLWRHPGFAELTDAEKVLALYILTGPQTNRLGLYVFSIATAAEDLGTLPETLTKRLRKVSGTFGWPFDNPSRVIFIPSWFKWNPPDGVNVMKGNLKDLNEIPPSGLLDAFASNIETLPATLHETFLEGVRQRLAKPSRTQDQEQYQYQKQKREQKTALRALVTEKPDNGPTPDAWLLMIAREVIRESPKNPNIATTEYLIDAFLNRCAHEGKYADKGLAIKALAQSQEGMTA